MIDIEKIRKHKKAIKIALLCAVVLAFAGIFLFVQRIALNRDYARIQRAGTLKVTCEYADGVFFSGENGESGFHYELIKAFAESHDLTLSINASSSYEQMSKQLKEGACDLIASPIPMVETSEKDSIFALTNPVCINSLVLVQRAFNPDDSTKYIKSAMELENRTLYIPKSSPYIMRLENLQDEIGANVNIGRINKYGTEQLLALVAHDDIDYTVCDANIARQYSADYPQLDFSKKLSFNQFYSWAVHKSSTGLLRELNEWLDKYKKTDEYRELLKKYGFTVVE